MGGRSSPTYGDGDNNASAPKEVKREENINIHNRVRQQRAQNIFSAPIDLNEEYQTPRYPKSDAAVQFIDSALEDNFIFASLTAKERRLLIDAMMLETVPAGTVIIKQGESTSSQPVSLQCVALICSSIPVSFAAFVCFSRRLLLRY